jgi:seryl-tRNA synthetase
MKKIILSISLLVILLLPQYSYAFEGLDINSRPSTKSALVNGETIKTGSEKLQVKIATRSALSQNQLGNLKQRADNEIKRRIDALNKLLGILSQSKKLSATDAANLTSQVQANINSLNTLKTKIDADTDLVTLKTDVKSIISNYYIFAFFLNYVHLNAAFDRATTTMNNMTTVWTKLQAKIAEAKSKGQDVTALNTQLSDMQNKLNNVKSIIASAQGELTGLSFSGYPGNKSTLQDARTKLQTVYQDLKTGYQDARKIVEGLGIDKHDDLTPTPTQMLTPTPTLMETPTP